MDYHTILSYAGQVAVVAPWALFTSLGLPMLIGKKLPEPRVAQLTQLAVLIGLASTLVVLVCMLLLGVREIPAYAGKWAWLPNGEYEFVLEFQFDRLSIPFTILSFALVGVVSAFAHAYMHLEPGYHRFFLLLSLFLAGMILASVAGTIETVFAGWELVGLSSALLVAFFHERVAPVRNGLRVWVVYRLTDAAFLAAAVVMHHLVGKGDLSLLTGQGPWPEGRSNMPAELAVWVGGLLLIAIAGKSGLVPFSGWLPRAMEGPTPSSAIFYGALSIHLGTYLLLRISPLLDLSAWLAGTVVLLGALTAGAAALAARVQADIKSALAYASVAQVGIIVVEIGLGLRYIPLIHIIGHACLRTLQLLRAPSLLHDYHSMESALGGDRPHRAAWYSHNTWWYRWTLERAYLDALLTDYVVGPFLRLMRTFDAWERSIRGCTAAPTTSLLDRSNKKHASEEKQ